MTEVMTMQATEIMRKHLEGHRRATLDAFLERRAESEHVDADGPPEAV